MPSPAPNTFESPGAYLTWDHDQLDAMLEAARENFAGGEIERAAALVREFRERLLRHIKLEEEVLFPEFERRTGITHGPTVVMHAEHQRIQEELAALADAAGRGDADGFFAACDELDAVLPAHNMKEESVLYPAIDGVLGDEELRAMTARLRSS